uniref:Uncharacterized protein n=1 Tax=Amblyomma triste TaxID=251400 RepID=A0A023G3G3_AMBTT
MKLIATCLHLLLQVVQFTSPTPLSVPKNPIASNTVGFLKDGICHYGLVFFKGERYPEDTCTRVTCYGPQRQMTVETCLSSQEFKGLCKRKAILREKTGRFPYCCDLYTCRDQGISPDAAAFPMERILPDEVTPSIIIRVGNTYPDTETDIFIGEIKTYTADLDPDDNEIHEAMASGYWKAKRVYITSACHSATNGNSSGNAMNMYLTRYIFILRLQLSANLDCDYGTLLTTSTHPFYDCGCGIRHSYHLPDLRYNVQESWFD